MEAPANFEISDEVAIYRPTGRVGLAKAVALITAGILAARELRISKLLVDIRGLTGFPPPTVTDRYFLAQEWALAARSAVRVAMVSTPELIDPQKFGVAVARNRGFVVDIFSSEELARVWLEGAAPPGESVRELS